MPIRIALVALASFFFVFMTMSAQAKSSYQDLIALFEEWREFESPPIVDGAPDYTPATTKRRHAELKKLQKRLDAIDTEGWPVDKKVDWRLVWAEMNGLDFYIRVLKPWTRDPAFYQQIWTYQSDTPAHEGGVNHAIVELWQYEFPLDDAAAAKLATELKGVSPLLAQAKDNLTGNAADLWNASIKTMDKQEAALVELGPKLTRPETKGAQADALAATRDFKAWLIAEAPKKDGPSGIGKDNYTWMLQNVHLLPLTWEDEVMILKRELKRSHASLELEEHRNRNLPPLKVADSPEAYEKLANDSVTKFISFLDQNDVIDMKDYMDEEIRSRRGEFVPEEERNFFAITTHMEPMGLWSHFYHWWDLARMRETPHESPIRRAPILYNIWDSRSEGMATGMEEMMLHAGLYDDNPRGREIVWIMLAQRAARGLASLYAQSNDFTMKEASDFHVEWTPRGWMSPSLDLLGTEQQLYLRQPGYGTSYVTGKALLEQLLADRAHQEGENYALKDFFREVDAAGMIPVPMIRWQLTGDSSEIEAIAKK